jgi:hypothetical protein
MATNKAKQAIGKWQLAASRKKLNTRSTPSRNQRRRKRRSKHCLRFRDARGKTVEFVEMWADADFPCMEIGFADKTALLFVMDTRLVMEPAYTSWKTGNQRILRRWPAVECR